MGYRGENDLSQGQNVEIIKLNGDETRIELPDSSFVRDAHMTRDGMDLNLQTDEGTLTIEGYFSALSAPDLVAPDGSTLTPDLVNSFATSSPEYAQNLSMMDISPVGAVDEFTGNATVTRADGSTEQVGMGTKIYEGDIIETGSDGAVNIMFVDETTFAVSEDARMAIDEYVFDASTQDGVQNFSVLKGVFVFTSGLIGREDPDDVMIETPVGSIGIRGTIIAGDVDNGEITVVEGAIVLRDFSGNELTLANQFETAQFDQSGGTINRIGELSANDVGVKFASVSNVSPQLFSSIQDAAAEEGRNTDGSIDASTESGESSNAPEAETQTQQEQQQEQKTDQPESDQSEQFINDAEGSVDENNDNQVDGTVQDGTAPEGEPNQAGEAGAESSTAEGQTDAKPAQEGPKATADRLMGKNQLMGDKGDLDFSNVGKTTTQLSPTGETTTALSGGSTDSTAGSLEGINTTTNTNDGLEFGGWGVLKANSNFVSLSGNKFISETPKRGFVTEDSVVKYNLNDNFNNPTGEPLQFSIKGIRESDGTLINDWNTNEVYITSSGVLVVDANMINITETNTYSIAIEAKDSNGNTATSIFGVQIVDAAGVGSTGDDGTAGTPATALTSVAAGDIIIALDGNDYLQFGHEGVKMYGDGGNDTFYSNANAYNALIDGGVGHDTMDYSAAQTGADIEIKFKDNGITAEDSFGNTDHLHSIESFIGNGNAHKVMLTEFDGFSVLKFNVGDTVTLDLNKGPVTKSYEFDNFDIFNLGTKQDTVELYDLPLTFTIVDGGAGVDTIDASNLTAGINLDLNTGNLNPGPSMVLNNFENVIGTDFNDTIVGNGGDNYIHGGAGDDTIHDGFGRDSIEGAAGNDQIFLKDTRNDVNGGDGNDTIHFNLADFGGPSGFLSALSNEHNNGHFVDGGNDDQTALSSFGDVLSIEGGGVLNFTNVGSMNASEHINNIETLDIQNGQSNVLTLKISDIIKMTDGDNQLIIKADGADSINIISDDGYTHLGNTVNFGDIGGTGPLHTEISFSDGANTVNVYIEDSIAATANVTV